jgi:hypothetical protein
MPPESDSDVALARTAGPGAIPELLSSSSEPVLRALIENPGLDETHVFILLERKDLPGTLLEEIARRKTWQAVYRVRRALVVHPHTPRLVAMRLLRDLHLLDLVRVSLLPATPVEVRRLAEERLLAQLPVLPLGQKLMLARRGSARTAGGLVEHGPAQVARAALDNALLTEAQVLKALAKHALPGETVALIAKHEKWSKQVNVRVAVLRHPNAAFECALTFLPDLPRANIEDLLRLSRLSKNVRAHLRAELARRENQ